MEAALASSSINFDTEVFYDGNNRFQDYNREIIDREDDYKRRRLNQDEAPEETEGMTDCLPFMKPLDYQYFGALLSEDDEDDLSKDEQNERKIMKLLLQVKNGTPSLRKTALKQLTDKSREFGAELLLNVIIPLLMLPTLEDQERHFLLKVIDRVVYKLDDLVRPYVLKILVVIEPMLVDEEYYHSYDYDARAEGQQILYNLVKAVGLATMTDAMHEYVRNTTARAFSVVASAALGIPALLPLLKTVCESRDQRHTGINIVGQIAILKGGCAVLPHLTSLVEMIKHGLRDENHEVKTMTALSLAALAEVAAPYGIQSFDSVLRPLWKGIRSHRGNAFIKAIGFIIPLMDDLYAGYYIKKVMPILIHEFLQYPDEETKRILVKVVKQCVSTEGVEGDYIYNDIVAEFFRNIWVRSMGLNGSREYKQQVVETTVEIANKVGGSAIVSRIVEGLRDESEAYRRMVMETIGKVVANMGASDIDPGLEELLIDGILYAFQEQTVNEDDDDANVMMLNGFVAVVNYLGQRIKPYLVQIRGIINWRLDNNRSAKVRQQAADLISRIAVLMKQCQEEQLMVDLGVVLFEYLGEENPDILGSILGALKAIVNVIGMTFPPIQDELLPSLTTILINQDHEKVQENCIDLVGLIADHHPGAELIRICFEILFEKLKEEHNTGGGIRRATLNTFRYIAKTIGPQDVLSILLNIFKLQESQNETLGVTLMNEYRVVPVHVQNDVLKSLSFLFEYIGEIGKDYIYAVTPLLEDALMDPRNRQTAASVVKHMAIGVAGLGCEDALRHLFNCLWPNNNINIFETLPPDVINAVMEAVKGMRVALGAPFVLNNYCLQEEGLFHPARKVRQVYWEIYNSLYIGSQDALVAAAAAYPMFLENKNNVYSRPELTLFI